MKPRNISDRERDAMVAARKAAGLTQEEAAELVYTPPRTYQDWELGRAGMHRAIYERLLQHLRPADELWDQVSKTTPRY